MHLEIPQVSFGCCAMDSIGQPPTMSKGDRFGLTLICLLTSYLITVPMKTKMANEVSLTKFYLKPDVVNLFFAG